MVADGWHHQPVEPQSSIAKEIFARYSAGETIRAIASDLNARGVPSPGSSWKRATRRLDGRWLVSTLHAILHNEVYVGRVVWNRSTWVKNSDTGVRERREHPESEWVKRECTALVDEDTWGKVCAQMNNNGSKGGGKGAKPRDMLSGLLFCDVCGSKMIAAGASYRCGTFHGGGVHACFNIITVKRLLAEQLITAPILSNLLSNHAVGHALKTIRELARQEALPSQHTSNPALAKANLRIAEIQRLVRDGVLSADEAQAPLKRAQQERDQASAMTPLAPIRVSDADVMKILAEYKSLVKNIRGRITGKDAVEAREILQAIFGSVRVVPTIEGSERYLTAKFERTEMPLLAAQEAINFEAVNASGKISNKINALQVCSGGMIRNYNHRNYHEIFFDGDSLSGQENN